MANDKTKKKAADLSDSIKAGYKAATEEHGKFLASTPCAELLQIIAERVTAADESGQPLNVEDLLKAEGIKNPQKVQRCSKFIELIQAVTKDSGHPLAVVNGRICYYNGIYWEYVNNLDFGYFLTRAALLLGVDRYNAIYCDFVNNAAKSFEIACRADIVPRAAANLLNCKNGTVEIHADGTAELRGHSWRDGLLNVLPYDYDPQATAPRWARFLNEVLPDDRDQANLQEYCGSLFAPINHEKIAYLYGATGRNGKTTAKDIICAVLGNANVSNESLESLTERGGTGEAARAALEGKLLNACGEVEHKISSSSILKKLASRERLAVRPPYQSHTREISDYARLLFCANDLPVFTQGAASAEARRFLFIEFAQRIPAAKVNRNLAREIIAEELPGVLNWMIEGMKRLVAQGGAFTPNPNAEIITAQFLEGSNSVFAYLRNYGLKPVTRGNKIKYPHAREIQIENGALYGNKLEFAAPAYESIDSYTQFCRVNGRLPQGRNTFLQSLQQLGYSTKRTERGRCVEFLVLSAEELEKEREPRNSDLTLWQ